MAVEKINNTVIINGEKYRTINSDELRLSSYQMAEQIYETFDKDFAIISIGHGGNDIAGYIVDYFRSVKDGNWEPDIFYHVGKSYKDNKQTGKFESSQSLDDKAKKYVKGKKVVVVDDVSDTGKTFLTVFKELETEVFAGEKYDNMKSAAFVKEDAKFMPDFTPEKKVPRDIWLIFPRERGESGRIILEKHGIEDGVKGMFELGYDMGLVDTICKNSGFDKKEYKDIVYKIFSKKNGGN